MFSDVAGFLTSQPTFANRRLSVLVHTSMQKHPACSAAGKRPNHSQMNTLRIKYTAFSEHLPRRHKSQFLFDSN